MPTSTSFTIVAAVVVAVVSSFWLLCSWNFYQIENYHGIRCCMVKWDIHKSTTISWWSNCYSHKTLNLNLIVSFFFCFFGVFCLLFYWAFISVSMRISFLVYSKSHGFFGMKMEKTKQVKRFFFILVKKRNKNKHFINEIRFLSFFHREIWVEYQTPSLLNHK